MVRRMMVVGMVVLGFLFGFSNYSCSEENGLVACWNFDEGSGEVAHDQSGNKNDGKIYGAAYVKRGEGYALEFDGEDDYVDCGNNESLNFLTGDFSI